MRIFYLAILIAIIIKLANSPKIRYKRKNYPYSKTKSKPEWTSEWKWDEKSQKWVHPNSIKEEPETRRGEQQTKTETNTEPEIKIDFAHAYQAQPLFTRNEWQNYKTLRDIAEVKGYIICPKVRLLDIIRPRNGEQKYKTLLYKIQSKHVDFVICDQNMTIKAIIELDDSTHDTQKGKERDAFVDTVLRSVGYKVIHTRYINHDILDLV